MLKKPSFINESDIPPGATIVEAFTPSISELFFIRNSRFKKGMPEAAAPLEEFRAHHGVQEVWIHYPWRNVVVHTVGEAEYFELRTARNHNVITVSEQAAYRSMHVGVAGLSVGSAIVQALVASGGPKKLSIADFDTLEVSNLNRLRATLLDVGMNKAEIAAHNVWEVDPFAEIDLHPAGLSAEKLKDFFMGSLGVISIFVDEMDSIDLKIKSRLFARSQGIPVVMATDNGDGVIVDVERFDEEPERPMFHGLVDDMDPEHMTNIDFKTWMKLATRIVGPEYLPESMRRSILEIGKTIPAIPQLGPSASMAGAAVSFVVRRIANKLPMPSGRYTINLEEKLVPGYNAPQSIEARTASLESFKQSFSP